MILSFMGFLLAFTLIGLSSAWQSRGTRHDYYLAQNTVKPWLVGLSAVASNFSGYMFIGLIGYCYATGLASIWMMVGWLLGDFLSSLFVHSRLHKATSNCDEVSYAGVLSNWYGSNNSRLQRLIGFVSLVFLLAYASAQLVAGGKALHVLFDWPTWAGIVMGAVLVTLYCSAVQSSTNMLHSFANMLRSQSKHDERNMWWQTSNQLVGIWLHSRIFSGLVLLAILLTLVKNFSSHFKHICVTTQTYLKPHPKGLTFRSFA